jgi:hypothetical protein
MLAEDGGTGFVRTISIDRDTYNSVKVFRNTRQTGRETFTARDQGNEAQWGKLQHVAQASADENAQAKANSLLNLYNKEQRTMSVTGVHGHPQVRAGFLLKVSRTLSGDSIDSVCVVERTRHYWQGGRYAMDLELRMVRGGNPTGDEARALGWSEWAKQSTGRVIRASTVWDRPGGVPNAIPLASLSVGRTVSVRNATPVYGVVWVFITYETDRSGWILGNAMVPVVGGKQVRYVSGNGSKVRSSPGGPLVTTMKDGTINRGSLLIVDSSAQSVRAAVAGSSDPTVYTWDYVSYFQLEDPPGVDYDNRVPDVKRTGWVAREFTEEVPRSVPSKSQVISEDNIAKDSELRLNRQNDMLTNARYIHDYLRKRGWTNNAIYGMLGNIEQESHMNPGMWEVLNNTDRGYGLTQWTPTSKYINELPIGARKEDIDRQLERIELEVATEDLQWISSKHTPQMTFSEFTQPTDKTVEELAIYFLRCYENPHPDGNYPQAMLDTRRNHARKWHDVISALL